LKPWFDANGMVPTNKFRRNMTNEFIYHLSFSHFTINLFM